MRTYRIWFEEEGTDLIAYIGVLTVDADDLEEAEVLARKQAHEKGFKKVRLAAAELIEGGF